MSDEARGKGSPKTAGELLDLYYLDLRSALLELAAGLDRIQAAQGGADAIQDIRVQRLLEGSQLVGTVERDRALRFQELLSGD